MKLLRTLNWSTPLLAGVCVVLGAGWFCVAGAAVVIDDPNLPPEPDPPECLLIRTMYQGSGGVHALFPGPIDFSDPLHKCFKNVQYTQEGSNEIEDFDSEMEGRISLYGGPPTDVKLKGPVTTRVYDKVGHVTGSFATEIVAMDLTADVGGETIMIRQSPEVPSPGHTSITDVGGGLYEIDSFFDVTVDLSTDGGMTWLPQTNGPAHMALMYAGPIDYPAVSHWGLVVLALVVLAAGAIVVWRRTRPARV